MNANRFEWLQPPFHFGQPPGEVQTCTQEPALVARPAKGKPQIAALPNDAFLELAELNPSSPEQILEFANRHGWLTSPRLSIIPVNKGHGGARAEAIEGELHSDWSQAIRRMRRCATVWQAVKTHDAEALRKLFHRVDAHRLEYLGSKRIIGGVAVYDGAESLDFPEVLKENDPTDWATAYLIKTINKHRAGQVMLVLQRDPESGIIGELNRPSSLHAALWQQFAHAVIANASIRPCDECGKFMLITLGEHRTNRRTCSYACRARIYHSRKQDARAMRQEKIPLKEIAARLDTSVAQIKKWTESASS